MGYSATKWWRETDGTRVYLTRGWVVPEWRGRGIGRAMLRWAESRLRAIAATHPRDGQPFLAAHARSSETDTAALLADAGYRVAFTVLEYEMADLSHVAALPSPDGLATRPLSTRDLPDLFRSIRDAYAQDPFSEEESHERWVAGLTSLEDWHVPLGRSHRRDRWAGPCVAHKGRGEICEASVRQPHRSLGLGRALLSRGLDDLSARGLTSARVHTLAENPYSPPLFYEAVGFRLAKSFPRYRKPLDVPPAASP